MKLEFVNMLREQVLITGLLKQVFIYVLLLQVQYTSGRNGSEMRTYREIVRVKQVFGIEYN